MKLLQSGGAHGTFYNDHEQLSALHNKRKPVAIWQNSLPIAKRRVSYLNENGDLVEGDFFARVSVFVNRQGLVVDADAT